MSTEKKSINVTFRIADIISKKFGLFPIEPKSNELKLDYQFTVKTISKIDEVNKTISVINYVVVFFDKEQTQKIIELDTEIIFEVKNFDDIVSKKNDDELNLPEAVIKSFIGIALSTIRGILFSRTENTQFKKVFLPPINVSKFKAQKVDLKELNI